MDNKCVRRGKKNEKKKKAVKKRCFVEDTIAYKKSIMTLICIFVVTFSGHFIDNDQNPPKKKKDFFFFIECIMLRVLCFSSHRFAANLFLKIFTFLHN